MAEAVKRGHYDPYRNMGYAYDGSAARVLDGEGAVRPEPRVRPRDRAVQRPQVAVRQAGAVSIFAVVGFLVVAAMAIMILMSCATLSALSDQVVEQSGTLERLKSEEATLLARYELAYDLGAIEKQVTADGSMGRPQPGQLVYVDLTEPDSVILYDAAISAPKAGFLENLEEAVGYTLAYLQGDGA